MSEKKQEQENLFANKTMIYINGFYTTYSLVDFQIMLVQNGAQIGVLGMTPVTAKNLAKTLLASVADYERIFETTVDEYADLNEKAQKKEKNK